MINVKNFNDYIKENFEDTNDSSSEYYTAPDETSYLIFRNNNEIDYLVASFSDIKKKIKELNADDNDDWEIHSTKGELDRAIKYFQENPHYLNIK